MTGNGRKCPFVAEQMSVAAVLSYGRRALGSADATPQRKACRTVPTMPTRSGAELELLDGSRAAQLIAAQLPALRGLPVQRVAQGQDHKLFAAGEEWLVRFPKHADRASWLERELSIMTIVAETVPSGVPRPELIGQRSDAYPHPFFAYRRIPGVAADQTPIADPARLAGDVGRMLDALHRINPNRIPPTPAGWERLTLEYDRTKLVSYASAPAGLLKPELAAYAEPYLTGTAPVPRREAPRRFIHNDVCPNHLIVNPRTGRLNGIIDFTDAMIGDPLLDFVGLVGLGGRRFIDRALIHYKLPLGQRFDAALEWLARTLTLRWLAEAATHDPTEIPKHVRWVELAFGFEN
jgi:aminoglycoside phosphotransferase (APT) family kinase protein